ncbi:MAG: DUF3787 domain-containing protein [Clostridiaceae bacterium]|nr:DUF3787 domain-containing protein [Clostridiaceae bacterium]
MTDKNRKLDPDKLKEWRTLAIAEVHEELPETKVSIPSEISVELAKEFVDENHK